MTKCWCGGRTARGLKGTVEVDVCLESSLHDPFATGRPERVETLYIAGPMSGYPDCNYPFFNEVEGRLEDVGFKVVNPARVHIDQQHHYVDLIREDLRQMLEAHGVATLENWWESTGARNEVQVAGILKMPVRPWQDWLERAGQE